MEVDSSPPPGTFGVALVGGFEAGRLRSKFAMMCVVSSVNFNLEDFCEHCQLA